MPCFSVCGTQMLFQACQVLYSSQSLWTADTVCLIHTQSLASSPCDSVLRPVLTIIDCMISVSVNQVSAAVLWFRAVND